MENSTPILLLARLLDRHFTSVAQMAIDGVLRDVGTYLGDAEATAEVDGVVRECIEAAPRPRVVIAHSLGSVVAYNVLRKHAIEVDHLVTLGSPLGVKAVISRLESAPTWPQRLHAWTNAADIRDIVALAPSLDRTSLFAAMKGVRFNVANVIDVENETPNRHGIGGYLSDPVVASIIFRAARLAEPE